jgi:hypothetical protein
MRWHASHKAMQSRPKRFMARRTADTVKGKGIQDGQPAGTGGGLTVTYDVAAESDEEGASSTLPPLSADGQSAIIDGRKEAAARGAISRRRREVAPLVLSA